MKKRLLFINLALALALTTLTPATALAAKPVSFSASGEITGISGGTVLPAGKFGDTDSASGRWRVVERDLSGTFLPGEDISGDFTLTYKANVELATQAGNLHGTLVAGGNVLKVDGKIAPLGFVWFEPFSTYLPKLTISGRWTSIEGVQGNGDFSAWATFVPTPDGHVDFIVDSAIDLTGKWQP